MKLSQLESRQLEKWAAGQLDDMGVSNPSVLGKIISSLVNEDKSVPELKKHCINELKVFLKDGTADFVEFLFDALDDGSYRTGIDVNENSGDEGGQEENESEGRGRDRYSSPPRSDEEDERRPRGRDRFESFDNADTPEPTVSNYAPSSSAGPRGVPAQGPRGQFQQQGRGQGQDRYNPTNPSGAAAPRGQPRGPPYNNYNNNNTQYNAQQLGGYPPRGGFNAGQHNTYPPQNSYPHHQPYPAQGAAPGVAYNKFAGRGEPRGPRGAPAPRGPPQINDTATYNPYAMPILPQLQPQYQLAPPQGPTMVPVADPNLAPGVPVTGMYPQYAQPPVGVYVSQQPQQQYAQEGYYPQQGFPPQGSMSIGPDGQPHQIQMQQPLPPQQMYGYNDNTQHQPTEPTVGSKRSYGYDQQESVYPPPQPQEAYMYPQNQYPPVPTQQLNAAAPPYIPNPSSDYSNNVYEAQHPPPPHQTPQHPPQYSQGGYHPPPPSTAAPGGGNSYGSAITSTNYHQGDNSNFTSHTNPVPHPPRGQKGTYLQEHERVTLRVFSLPIRYSEEAIRQHFEEHGHVVAVQLVNNAADDASIPHYKKTYTECLVQYYSAQNAKKRLQEPRTVFDNPYVSLRQWFVNIVPPAEVVTPSSEVLQRDAQILQHGPIRAPPVPRHQAQGQGFNKFTTSNKYRRTSDSDPSVPSSNVSNNDKDPAPLELDANGDFPSVAPSYATSNDTATEGENHSAAPSYAEVVVGGSTVMTAEAPAESTISAASQQQHQAVKSQAREALDSLKTLRQQAEELSKKKEAILLAQVEKCRAMVDELEQTEDSESRQSMLNNLEAKILALQTQLRAVREQQSERAAEALAAASSPTGASGAAARPQASYPSYQQQQPYAGRGGRGRGRFSNTYPYPTYPAQPGGRGFYRGRGGGRGRGRGRGRFGGRGEYTDNNESNYESNEGGDGAGDFHGEEGGGDGQYYEQGGAEDQGGGDYSEEH